MFIETERTPNPATLKFLPGRAVMASGTADFPDPETAQDSPLAAALFALGDIEGVFFGSDFVSVTKAEGSADWTSLKPQVNPNLYTIGIEHEGKGASEWSDAMYRSSARLIADVCTRWSIPIDRQHVVGHREIYGRKTCPNGVVDLDRLIEMAREVSEESNRGQQFDPPLSTDELAFYDAVSTNDSAVELQGEDVLAKIARDLVGIMRQDVKTDWTVRDDVRAKLRSSIKRLLVKYKYLPDKQPEAIRLVIEQMEAMAPRYVEENGTS